MKRWSLISNSSYREWRRENRYQFSTARATCPTSKPAFGNLIIGLLNSYGTRPSPLTRLRQGFPRRNINSFAASSKENFSKLRKNRKRGFFPTLLTRGIFAACFAERF